MGAEPIIDRNAEGYRFWKDEHTQDPKEWQRFGKRIRELTGGDDVDIVFEHPGRETFGAVGLRHAQGRHDRDLRVDLRLHARVRQPLPVDEPQADRRLALRQLPRGVGGQPAGRRGRIHPTLSQVVPARRTPARPRTTCTATCTRARSASSCLAPSEGLGVRDPELRARHLAAINRFRRGLSRPSRVR